MHRRKFGRERDINTIMPRLYIGQAPHTHHHHHPFASPSPLLSSSSSSLVRVEVSCMSQSVRVSEGSFEGRKQRE